jgi:hypothetical protein
MFSKKTKTPPITREDSLAMRPIRMADVEMDVDDAGNGKLRVPMRPTRIASFLGAKLPPRPKTFEFDAVGVYLWKQLDGKTSVEQLIRRIGKQYNLELRQAEASTVAFLKTLMQKGLVGMAGVEEKK